MENIAEKDILDRIDPGTICRSYGAGRISRIFFATKTPQYDLPDLPQYHLPELRGRQKAPKIRLDFEKEG